jgi:hypothetical protein
LAKRREEREIIMNAVLARPSVTMKIPDLQSGFQILSRLPLANIEQCQTRTQPLPRQPAAVAAAGDVYLQTARADADLALLHRGGTRRRYTGKPLPLG